MDYTIQDFKAPDQEPRHQVVVGTICIVLVVFLVTWFTRKRDGPAPKHCLPPGPKGWPVFGAFPLLRGHKHVAFHKLSTKYGPLMFMYLGSVPTLVVSNAKMVEEVYKTNDRIMASRPKLTTSSYLFYNCQDIAFAPYGNYWRQTRKICTLELFTTRRINQFQKKRQHEINRMVRSMLEEAQRGNTIQIDQFFGAMSMNITTQMMWNKSHHTYKDTSSTDEVDNISVDFFREFSAVIAEDNIGDFIPWPGLNWLFMNLLGLNKRMTAVRQKADNFIGKIIREHKQQRSVAPMMTKKVPSEVDDFVDVLLNHTMQSEANQGLSEHSIKAILLDMILGGTDTTANTLEWALTELLRKPHILRKVQDELSLVVGANRLVNEDDIPKLNFLNAVLRETLRLHPALPLSVPHTSTKDCEIHGYHVPAGSLVFINIWAIHQDSEMWERALEFDPKRFLGQEASTRVNVDWKGQDLQLIPFGAGRRICPGMSLASPVLHLALAQVLHCMECSLPGEQKPEDLDMTEGIALLSSKRIPLVIAATPRLSSDVMISEEL